MLVIVEDLLATFDTERLKTLFIWAQVDECDMDVRIRRGLRTLHEHMAHQCVSESFWMRSILDFPGREPLLPKVESQASFLDHYLGQSAAHLAYLQSRSSGWFKAATRFSNSPCSRFWVLLRRMNDTAHYRGQMTILLRALGKEGYSGYEGNDSITGKLEDPPDLGQLEPISTAVSLRKK